MGISVFTCRKRDSHPRPLRQAQGRPLSRRWERGGKRRSNLWQRVRFELCGIELERRLVPEVEDEGRDINAQSPVGKALLTASVGERITVEAPGGDVVVKVLEIV